MHQDGADDDHVMALRERLQEPRGCAGLRRLRKLAPVPLPRAEPAMQVKPLLAQKNITNSTVADPVAATCHDMYGTGCPEGCHKDDKMWLNAGIIPTIKDSTVQQMKSDKGMPQNYIKIRVGFSSAKISNLSGRAEAGWGKGAGGARKGHGPRLLQAQDVDARLAGGVHNLMHAVHESLRHNKILAVNKVDYYWRNADIIFLLAT